MIKRQKIDRAQRARRRIYLRQLFRGNGVYLAVLAAYTLVMVAMNLGLSWMIAQALDLANGSGAVLSFRALLLVGLGLVASSLVLMALGAVGQSGLISRALARYREFVYGELLKKDLAVFLGSDSAAWLSALTNDVGSIETNFLLKCKDVLGDGLLFVGALAMMFYYSPTLAVISLLLGALPLLVSMATGPRIARAETALSDENRRFVAAVKEGLTGFSVIKTFRSEREAQTLFCEENLRVQRAKRRRLFLGGLLGSMGSLASVISQVGLLAIGCWMCLSGAGLTPGTLFIFMNLTGIALMFVSALPDFAASLAACMALIDKLDAMLTAGGDAPQGRAIPRRLDVGIALEHVSAGYAPGEMVLRDVSATFAAGRCYAVVGASGCGKSTLLRLLMAAMPGYGGSVQIDGAELRDVLKHSLYELMALVDQNVFVFDRSIRENITMFRDFPEEEVQRAIRLSGLSGLVAHKGEGYRCGENGSALSGGERQRISIARSLLRRAPVLLADEATASLDRETAHQVSDAILRLEGITRIVVTHALEEALLRRYDGILVLKDGAITERGTFDELMAARGYFYALYTLSQ